MENGSIGRLLRLSSVITQVGLKKTSIYDGIKHGTFPAPIKLGARAVAWPATEIEAWKKSRTQQGAK